MTMTADPGYIPKSSSRGQTKKTIDDLLENGIYNEKHFCTPCMIRKPLRSKHCRRCGRCVARQDQYVASLILETKLRLLTIPSHCPWVDTCIGVNNHKHFLLYVISLIIGISCLIRLTFVCKYCNANHSTHHNH
jgi:protein AFG1